MNRKEEKLALAEHFKKRRLLPEEAQEIMDGLSLIISMASLKELMDKAHGGQEK